MDKIFLTLPDALYLSLEEELWLLDNIGTYGDNWTYGFKNTAVGIWVNKLYEDALIMFRLTYGY